MGKRIFSKIVVLSAIVIVLYLALLSVPNILKLIYPLHFQSSISRYSDSYKLEAPLIAAIIKTESNFAAAAESNKGARGLMQITPSTGKWIAQKLKISDYNDDMLYDPETNIKFGCWYVKHLCEYYENDFNLVLAAYNGGMGNVDNWLKDYNVSRDGISLDNIPFKETKDFVKRVQKNYSIYNKLYEWSNNSENGE